MQGSKFFRNTFRVRIIVEFLITDNFTIKINKLTALTEFPIAFINKLRHAKDYWKEIK